jgi:hypothetical protein
MSFIGAGCGLVYKTSLSARLTSKLSPSLIGWYTPAMRQALVCTVGVLWSQTGALRRPGRVRRKGGVEYAWLCRLGAARACSKILLRNSNLIFRLCKTHNILNRPILCLQWSWLQCFGTQTLSPAPPPPNF